MKELVLIIQSLKRNHCFQKLRVSRQQVGGERLGILEKEEIIHCRHSVLGKAAGTG